MIFETVAFLRVVDIARAEEFIEDPGLLLLENTQAELVGATVLWMSDNAVPAAPSSKRHLMEWVKRYMPLELAGTAAALILAALANAASGNEIMIAYAGTWGENFGFYGFAGAREVLQYLGKTQDQRGIARALSVFLKSIRNIMLEFGPSELLDSFVLRPFLMLTFQVLTGNFVVGVLAGKIAADIVFYIIAVTAYESRKKYLGE